MTNQDGLLIDENGVVRGIEVPIDNEPITGFRRVARHHELVIKENLQMIQRVRIVKLNPDGTELTEALILDTEINANLRNQLLNAYQDTFYPAQTEGAFVSPETGMPVEETEEGAVEQLAFFQGITVGVLKGAGQTVNDSTSIPLLVYGLLLAEIMKLNAQGRL